MQKVEGSNPFIRSICFLRRWVRRTQLRKKHMERMKGFEPSTFCMASRRSSQLSYIRQIDPNGSEIISDLSGQDYSLAMVRMQTPRLHPAPCSRVHLHRYCFPWRHEKCEPA